MQQYISNKTNAVAMQWIIKILKKDDRWTKKVKKGGGMGAWEFGKNPGGPVLARADFCSHRATPS